LDVCFSRLMDLIYLLYFACLIIRYPDVEVNPGPRCVAPRKLRLLFNNINGLYGNISELGVAAAGYDLIVVLCRNQGHSAPPC